MRWGEGQAIFGNAWGRSEVCIDKPGCPGARGERADWEIGAWIEELNPERKGQGRVMFRGARGTRRNGSMH